MVTISQIRTKIRSFLASIRVKILLAFFVVVGASFIFAASNMNGVVQNYLTGQRTREDTQAAENLAVIYAPLFQSGDVTALNSRLQEDALGLDGRLLLVDMDGKVQYDSMNGLCGQRLEIREALRVLSGEDTASYGMHRPGRETVRRMTGDTEAEYVAYGVHEMQGSWGQIGALVYVSRIQGMMDSMEQVSQQLDTVFLLIGIMALILTLILSRVLTRPITNLSRTMRRMGEGDLSVRVPERGSGELRQLAENYNTMAAQLEKMDRSRYQFVSNASHELKTPMTSMKIMVESMLYDPKMPWDVRQEFLSDMNQEIDRLTGIITDLLTLTRMDNRQDAMKTENLDMSAMTEEIIRLLRPMAEKRNQRLESRVKPGLRMMGDGGKLNQVLYNLTDNAMKYTQDGGTIQVSLEEDGANLIWRVKDNGVGIPPEDQAHIFDRFYRVDKARSRETGGTGLGLSIVRQMVMMHGGSIRVESEAGKGSCFIVTLPKNRDRKGGQGA